MGSEVKDRLDREREFHDARFDGEDSRNSGRFYAINKASDRFFRDAIEALPAGSNFLDYGCGEGAYCAVHAAENGHSVTAIDISPVAVEKARERAEEFGVADRIEFGVMNAEDLQLPDASFDAVGGLGVLHHLDLELGLDNITRVMKSDATAFFVEPMGHNPAINMYRDRTPSERTPDEHPLMTEDVDAIGSRFERCDATYFHLLGLLAIPAIGRSFLDPLVDRLDQLDRVLFDHVSPARKFAWMVGLQMSRPRAAATAPR